MKSTRFFIFTGLLALLFSAGCTQPEPEVSATENQREWKLVEPRPNVEQKVRMAAFLDDNFGVTGGAGAFGKVHYTTDGGRTWTISETSGG